MAWRDFLQMSPENIAKARNTTWGTALAQDFNPRNINYQGFQANPANVAQSSRVGLGSYINQGLRSLTGKFTGGSNVGGATNLMRKIALSPVGRVAGAAFSLPAAAAYGIYKTPAMIEALTKRDANATKTSMFGLDIKNLEDKAAAYDAGDTNMPNASLRDWGFPGGDVPAAPEATNINTPPPNINTLDPMWQHQLRMQGIDRGNIDNRGIISTLKDKFSKFTTPGMALMKLMVEPNTPEEDFGRGYFQDRNRLSSSGRTLGNQAWDVFAGKNVATAYGQGMGGAAQKRIDRINETISDWEAKAAEGDEDAIQRLKNTKLIRRRDLFKKQLEQYNQDLGAATGGADTTGGATTTGGGYEDYGQGAASQETQRSYEGPGGGYTGAGEAADWGGGEKEGGLIRKAQGGRIGYADRGFVDEDINIEGPGFDENENLMASDPGAMDSLNEMSLNVFGKPLDMLTEEEYGILIDMANEQASAGQDQGLASLV